LRFYEIQRSRKSLYSGTGRFRKIVSEENRTQAPSRPRGRPPSPTARGAIIEATLELLAEGGFQAATIEAIAARAGVGRNTIYRRWPGKEELVVEALHELSVDLDEQEGDDLHSLLLDWIRDFARLFADPLFGRIFPAVLGELQRNPVFADAYIERVVHPRRRALVELLTGGVQRGELRRDVNVEQIADLLAGPPFVRLLPLGWPPVTEHYAEELLETIWRGIAPSAVRDRRA
jgi:AcrR family transcriptional regulator